MEFTPFTLAEATDVWDDFEDLKDTEFKSGASSVSLVHDVVICPFPRQDKKKFTANYLSTKDSKQALSFYTGDEYDVILFTADADDESDYSFIDIRTFAADKGISYAFPRMDVSPAVTTQLGTK